MTGQQEEKVVHFTVGYPIEDIRKPYGVIDVVDFTGTQ